MIYTVNMSVKKCVFAVALLFMVNPLQADALYARPCLKDTQTYIAVQDGLVIDSFRYHEAASGPCAESRELIDGSYFDQETLNMPDGVWIIGRESQGSVPIVTGPNNALGSTPRSVAAGAELLSDDPADIDSYYFRKQITMVLKPALSLLFGVVLVGMVSIGLWFVVRSWSDFVIKQLRIRSRLLRAAVPVVGYALPAVFVFWGMINLFVNQVPDQAILFIRIVNVYVAPYLFLASLIMVPALTVIALSRKFKNKHSVNAKIEE